MIEIKAKIGETFAQEYHEKELGHIPISWSEEKVVIHTDNKDDIKLIDQLILDHDPSKKLEPELYSQEGIILQLDAIWSFINQYRLSGKDVPAKTDKQLARWLKKGD